MFLSNHGGSHLPDLTVITPVVEQLCVYVNLTSHGVL